MTVESNLMAGTVAIAMFAASRANTAIDGATTTGVSQPSGQVQLAQADMASSNADLEPRIAAREVEAQDSEMRTAQAANASPPRRQAGGGATPRSRVARISMSPTSIILQITRRQLHRAITEPISTSSAFISASIAPLMMSFQPILRPI